MKFVLFVEGHTEKKSLPQFLKRWLDPQLRSPVGVKPVRFEGWAELVEEAPKKAMMHLENPKVIGVIALLDLYGPTIYPDDKTTAKERYAWAKQHLEEKVGDPKFRQFFAVHETEAWLLSDTSIFPNVIRTALASGASQPETVDFDKPPSNLLNRLYESHTRYSYKKVVYGSQLFAKLDPNVACKKCPRLKELLDEMLAMARVAGL